MYLGRSGDGVADIETAICLSPHDNLAPYWEAVLCNLHSNLARWGQAVDSCNAAAADGARAWGVLGNLAAAYAWSGRDKEAKEALFQLRESLSEFHVAILRVSGSHLRRTNIQG